MVTFFEGMFDASAAPMLANVLGDTSETWSVGVERVTAIQLPSGVSYSALFHEHGSEKLDNEGTEANSLKGKLWLPTSAKPSQRSTWRIVRSDSSETDFVCVSHGERSGGYLCVEVEQVTVSKFAGKFR